MVSEQRTIEQMVDFQPFTTEELLAVVRHEGYTDREKRLATQCLRLLDQLMRRGVDVLFTPTPEQLPDPPPTPIWSQETKELAYKLDPECWISYSGKPRKFKSYMDQRRLASLRRAAMESRKDE